MDILATVLKKKAAGKKQLAFLLDPDYYQGSKLHKAVELISQTQPDLILVGGSIVASNTQILVDTLKASISQPVVLYPGSLLQLVPSADAILFISLISGRNADFLIGNHVVAAPIIKQSGMEVIPTGYILIDGGKTTSVQYMSNTLPIPADKPNIAVATALAGQYLGMKLIYLEAGSGALQPVSSEIIQEVRKNIDLPILVGGGIDTCAKAEAACKAGADILVIGNAVEKDKDLLLAFKMIVEQFHTV